MKKQYKVGIYCRLSVDDASNSAKAKNYIPGDESASIENQYEILSKFVMFLISAPILSLPDTVPVPGIGFMKSR